MRTIVLAVMAISLSLFFFLNVRQAYLYQEEIALIEDLELQQQVWYEENRKIRTGVAILESPERLDSLAEETLGLEKAAPSQMVQILSSGSVD